MAGAIAICMAHGDREMTFLKALLRAKLIVECDAVLGITNGNARVRGNRSGHP